jgi:hypothetical protein
MNAPALDDLINLEQVSAWLSISPQTVLQKSKGRNPEIPAVRIGARILRWHPRTLLAKWAIEGGLSDATVAVAFSQVKLTLPPEALNTIQANGG